MKSFDIYFTTDTHGYVYPTNYRERIPKRQGLLSLAKQIKKTDKTLVIDGGDTIQGSPFTTFLNMDQYKNKQIKSDYIHPIAHVINAMSYDYVTLGNHDFNYGPSYLQSYINHLDAKCLAANVESKDGHLDVGDYDIRILPNGLKIGIIGVTTDFINRWEADSNLKTVEIRDTFQAFKKAYDKIKDKTDVLIGIYHGGFEYDLENGKKLSDTSENIAYRLCQSFPLDILLTGHQHMSIINQEIFGTHIIQVPAFAVQMAHIEINVNDKEEKEITSDWIRPDDHYNEDLYQELSYLENKVQSWLDGPLGYLDQSLEAGDHLEMALKGSLMCNFINQVQLETSGADISCTSLANSVKGFEKKVTVRDVVGTYVYPNTLLVIEITGAELKAALERCSEYFDLDEDGKPLISERFLKPKIEHYNYDYYAGINYKIDIRRPLGDRVVLLEKEGRSILPDEILSLALNNYRATGTGGYEMYQGKVPIKEFPMELTDILIDYIDRKKQVTVDKNSYFEVIYK